MDVFAERAVADCLYLEVTNFSDTDTIGQQIKSIMAVEKAADRLLTGDVTANDFLDLVEPHIIEIDGTMDDYLDISCQRLYQALLTSPYLRNHGI